MLAAFSSEISLGAVLAVLAVLGAAFGIRSRLYLDERRRRTQVEELLAAEQAKTAELSARAEHLRLKSDLTPLLGEIAELHRTLVDRAPLFERIMLAQAEQRALAEAAVAAITERVVRAEEAIMAALAAQAQALERVAKVMDRNGG